MRYVVAGDARFVSAVRAVLESSSSWAGELVVWTDRGPIDFYIWLADPVEATSRCGVWPGVTEEWQHNVSCSFGNMVVINSDRWYGGREEPPMSVPVWRQFIINHEVGHQLGQPDGGPCSVMNPRVCPGGVGERGPWPAEPDDQLRALAREWLANYRTPTA